MGSMKACLPYMAMVLVQLAYGGSNILAKLALEKGLSILAFTVYRHLIAILILGPMAFVLERKQCFTTMSWPILGKISVLALFGSTIHHNVYYVGLNYASPTVACALSGVVPALTFILAVLLRMEKVTITSVKGRVKLLGTIICISGALMFTFWKGYLFKGLVRRPLIMEHGNGSSHGVGRRGEDWIKGSALILVSFIAYSAWLILQANVCEAYKTRLSMNTLMCFFASLQSSVLALIFDRNPSSWRLEWNIQLFTILYCGTIISCLVYYLLTWCINEKGPVFSAMFCPLQLVIVGIFSAFFLAERLHLGSLIGASLIIIGLYSVLWGKSNDSHGDIDRREEDDCSLDQINQSVEMKSPKFIVPP